MQQIVDLHKDPAFQSLNIALVSVARDSLQEQAGAVSTFGLPTDVPLLVDADNAVAKAYDVQQYAMPNGEPSHTFVLVSAAGEILWVRDYGAPENPDRTMYVQPDQLIEQIREYLP